MTHDNGVSRRRLARIVNLYFHSVITSQNIRVPEAGDSDGVKGVKSPLEILNVQFEMALNSWILTIKGRSKSDSV